MEISGKVALVTGANRGLGRHLSEQLRDRGAIVYAAGGTPSWSTSGVTPVELDVTDLASIEAAAATHGTSILINNAGSSTGASLLEGTPRHPPRNGHALPRDARCCPCLRTAAPSTGTQCDAERPLRVVVAEHPELGCLLRRQVR